MSSVWLVTLQYHDYYDGWDEGTTKGYWSKERALAALPLNFKEDYDNHFHPNDGYKFSTRYVIKEVEMQV